MLIYDDCIEYFLFPLVSKQTSGAEISIIGNKCLLNDI